MSKVKNKRSFAFPQFSLLKKIFLLFLLWRTALFMVGQTADFFLPYWPSFPYADALLADFGLSRGVYSWGNFDGVHYLTIASQGYEGAGLIQAFFPLYPLLMKLISSLGFSEFWAGIGLSHAFFLLTLILFFMLTTLDFSKKAVWFGLITLLLFPTSFFFGAIYNESLFLALVLASFLFARKKYWLWASIIAGLASATRIVGVFLFPALLLEWAQQNKLSLPLAWDQLRKSLQKNWLPMLMLPISLLGVGTYMTYLWKTFGDPLYFFHVQAEFGAGRQESLIPLPQVIWRSLKILFTVRPFDWKYHSYVQDFLLSIGSLTVLLAGWKKIRPSYLLFSVLAWVLPTLTGTFSSMPRYILVCFPLFMLAGARLAETRPIFRYLALTISGILLIINTVLFIQGYWVA